MNREEQVGFGDERVETSNFARYKGTKDQTDRIAFICNNVKRVYTHYHNNKYFKCISTADQKGPCCEQLGSPDQRFGTVVFHYITDAKGNILDETKLQGTAKLWVFSESKYEELSNQHRQWPLLDNGKDSEQHDLLVKCTDTTYQKMTFTPCKHAHWKKHERWYKHLQEREGVAQERLTKMMGQNLSEADILAVLELDRSESPHVENLAEDIEIEDLLPEE